MARPTIKALIGHITDELGKGRIVEASIVGSRDHIEGLCNWETREVTVNPSVSVVDTLIHELLHRRFPTWTEERVRIETWRVMRSMSHADVRGWYRKYKLLAKRKTRPVRLRQSEI
jgi:hypothetical protein